MEEINTKEIGQSVKFTREETGLTQKELADMVGISRSYLSKFESGTRQLSEEKLGILMDCLLGKPEAPAYKVIIDYLTIHFFSSNYQSLIQEILGMALERFEFLEYAAFGYMGRYSWNNCINISSSVDDPKKGTLIELSGQGCKYLAMLLKTRKSDWPTLIQKVLDHQGNFTRIDFTLDDHLGMLEIPELADKIQLGHVRTAFRTSELIYSKNISENDSNGMTLYLGSRRSQCRFCFYQKNYEQRRRRGTPLEEAEVINRYELRYRKEKAQKLAQQLVGQPDFLTLFFELINGAVCFYDGDPNDPHTKIDAKWAIFIGNYDKLSLSLETIPQTFEKSVNWLSHGVSPTLSFIHEVDRTFHSTLLSTIIKNGEMNDHQQKIIENMKAEPEYYQKEVEFYEKILQEEKAEKTRR